MFHVALGVFVGREGIISTFLKIELTLLLVFFQREGYREIFVCLIKNRTRTDNLVGGGFGFREYVFHAQSPSFLYMTFRENIFSFIKLSTSLNRLSMVPNSESRRI